VSYRDARLRQFFHGYFHQDWDGKGAERWEDVIAQYVAEAPRRDVLVTRDDLRSWLADTAAASGPAPGLPASFRCDYDPRPDGLEEREWVGKMADLIEELTRG
jgi:hypothetical protein